MTDNETTIQLLQNAIDKVPELLSKSHLRSSDHIQWISDTLYLLEETSLVIIREYTYHSLAYLGNQAGYFSQGTTRWKEN